MSSDLDNLIILPGGSSVVKLGSLARDRGWK